MSFLDKVSKAVGDVVDKGKKDVEQFVKIQKINSEIGGMERKIADFERQIEQAKQAAGEKAIALLQSAALVSPELQPFVDQVRDFERRIESERTAIAARRSDIERIKAEHAAEHAAEHEAAAAPPAPVATEAVPAPPAVAPEGRVCSQCGAKVTGGAFCPQCGAKLS